MATTSQNHYNRVRRATRTRAGLKNNVSMPRLTVFRSLRHIYAQIIDDQQGKTLVSAHDGMIENKGNKTETARAVGEKVAELAKANKVSAVRFDRGAYKYHGRVAALADGARSKGLQF